MLAQQPLNSVQLELLKMFCYTPTDDKTLKEIRELLSNYLQKKIDDKLDKFWDDNNLSNEVMDKWLKEPS